MIGLSRRELIRASDLRSDSESARRVRNCVSTQETLRSRSGGIDSTGAASSRRLRKLRSLRVNLQDQSALIWRRSRFCKFASSLSRKAAFFARKVPKGAMQIVRRQSLVARWRPLAGGRLLFASLLEVSQQTSGFVGRPALACATGAPRRQASSPAGQASASGRVWAPAERRR